MAEYNVLNGDDNDTELTVAVLIPIPAAGNNEAGVQWQVAIRDYVLLTEGDTISVVPDLDPADQADLDAGAVFEKVTRYSQGFVGGLIPDDPAARKVKLDALIEADVANFLSEMQNVVKYFGFNGTST